MMIPGCLFVYNSTSHLVLGALYGPLWGLVVLFTILGVVFIMKALECMGVSAWKAMLPGRRTKRTISLLKKEGGDPGLHKSVSAVIPSAIWTGVQPEGAAGIADAGEVLFPGQASLAEALTRAYSEEIGDEALFSLCCEEELEDILAEAAEHSGQGPRRQEIPLAFLPLVTDGKFSTTGEAPGMQENQPARSAETASPAEAGELQKEGSTVAAGGETFPDLEFLPLIVEGDENEEQQALFEVSPPVTGSGFPDASVEENDVPDGGVSIFEDLLKKCDTEATMILLSELPAVGDTKELTLLKKLTFNENRRIRKLARKLYGELQSQLGAGAEVDMAVNRPDGPEITEVVEEREAVQEGKRPLEYCFLREAADSDRGVPADRTLTS